MVLYSSRGKGREARLYFFNVRSDWSTWSYEVANKYWRWRAIGDGLCEVKVNMPGLNDAKLVVDGLGEVELDESGLNDAQLVGDGQGKVEADKPGLDDAKLVVYGLGKVELGELG